MQNEIIITKKNGALNTTSKIVADVFGKTHRDVMRSIENLDCSAEFSLRNFATSDYSTERGKTYKCYNITERGFYMLAMGFTGKKAGAWKEAFLNEFERLQESAFNLDSKMTAISNEIDDITDAGKAWSKFGLEVKNRKRVAIEKKDALVNEVQLSLGFEG